MVHRGGTESGGLYMWTGGNVGEERRVEESRGEGREGKETN
jgi:hypothetical protein